MNYSQDPLENPSEVPVRRADFILENEGDDTAEQHYRRAMAHLDKGELNDARRELTSELMQRSVDSRYSFLLGKIYYLQNDYNEAQKNLRDALELGYSQTELFKLLADTYIHLGYTSRALATTDRLLELDNNPENISMKGRVLITLGDTVAAMDHFMRSIRQDSSIRGNYTGMVSVYNARGQEEKAGELINRYLSKNPADREMLLQKGTWLMSKNEFPGARDIYERLMEIEPRNAYFLEQHSRAYFLEGRYDSALIQARRALVLDENNLSAKVIVARSLENERLFDEAREVYSGILARDSSVIAAREGLERIERRDAYLRYLRKQEEQREAESLQLEPINPLNDGSQVP